MKREIYWMTCVLAACTLAACSKEKPADQTEGFPTAESRTEQTEQVSRPADGWNRQGYFQDEEENFLSVTWMDLDQESGWYVGCMLGENNYGGIVEAEGHTLTGKLPSIDGGAILLSVSEEGEDGLFVEVEGGDTYHFTPMEMQEATIFVSINVEGNGNIEYAEGEETPEIDEEYPFQSAQINLAEPETYTLLAWPRIGWKFVKWTKDGEDFANDAQITLELADSADYIAVFEKDEDWVNPVACLQGNYVAERAHAEVEIVGEDTAFVTIWWGDSAFTTYRWNIAGPVDMDTLTLKYNGCALTKVTYNETEETEEEALEYDNGTGDDQYPLVLTGEEEVLEYDNGTGTIVFTPDGPGFTWQDDMSDRGDVVFEWISES